VGADRSSSRSSARRVAEAPGGDAWVAGSVAWARILDAARQLVSRHGWETLAVGELCLASGTSRREFDEEFGGGVEDVLLELFQAELGRFRERMARAYREGHEQGWTEAIRGALYELLSAIDDDPGMARFLLVGSLSGSQALRATRCEALRRLAIALERERPQTGEGALDAPFGGEAVVGAVVSILHARLLEDPVPEMKALCGPLMGVTVLPYLGAGAARGEVARVQSGTGAARGGSSRGG
jgi:AcrR family transcriptional regulator